MTKLKITPAEGLEEISNYFEELNSQNENIIRLMIIVERMKDWVEEAHNAMNEAEESFDAIRQAAYHGIEDRPNNTITITT